MRSLKIPYEEPPFLCFENSNAQTAVSSLRPPHTVASTTREAPHASVSNVRVDRSLYTQRRVEIGLCRLAGRHAKDDVEDGRVVFVVGIPDLAALFPRRCACVASASAPSRQLRFSSSSSSSSSASSSSSSSSFFFFLLSSSSSHTNKAVPLLFLLVSRPFLPLRSFLVGPSE
jgi:hypothetical protein